MIAEVAADLRREATRSHERRLLVLAGAQSAGLAAAERALDGAGYPRSSVVYVGDANSLECESVPMAEASTLLGTTNDAVVFDAHAGFRPTLLGQVVGAVDGGGLLILCLPPLDSWPTNRDPADERLAVPPFGVEQVTGHYRRRFVETLRDHRGIAIVDVDNGILEADGLTESPPRTPRSPPAPPAHARFPHEAYESCLTADQVAALQALESLLREGNAVVIESDRGRGKSSVMGVAAACLAVGGDDVAVTAPNARNVREGFDRAVAVLEALDAPRSTDNGAESRVLSVTDAGRIRFIEPSSVLGDRPDVLLVDEAAGIGVPLLTDCLAIDRVAFATTVHGYEGTGRGFSVRFQGRLDDSPLSVTRVSMREPIRYAPGDPVEVWAFRALLLDARPAVSGAVTDARPAAVAYRQCRPSALLDDEAQLREVFGLLVLAHYRTEPDDLARLLDAPNVTVRALVYEGHVVSVALLAREGGLPTETRRRLYEGDRIRGNMLPDVLTSQLRDEAAGEAVGWRVLRIATHHAVRSRGLGSRLLEEIQSELAAEVDWFGTGFGATPALVSFWSEAGYGAVHLSTTRNDTSGEHSVLMLRPTSAAGEALAERHGRWFARRVVGQLSDALRSVDPDVVRATLDAVSVEVDPTLDEEAWQIVVGMAYGPGLLDVDPEPFRRLAAAWLMDPPVEDRLPPAEERLLVRRVLQSHPWETVADELEYQSRAECMRATGAVFQRIVDGFHPAIARTERERYE